MCWELIAVEKKRDEGADRVNEKLRLNEFVQRAMCITHSCYPNGDFFRRSPS